MDDGGSQGGSGGEPSSAVAVAVRVRPLNERERTEGHRQCVSFDEPTKQVVLTAVDKNTLLQLRGAAAKGYAFDRRYPQQATSDDIYDDCVSSLVEGCFKGYNATVLAYGQTGSGKTHTMSGGVGIHGKQEEGVTPRVIRHIYSIVEQIQRKAKPGEKVELSASALELYNEDLHDLSLRSGRDDARSGGWDSARSGASSGLKLQERPVGKDGRVVPEVVGLKEVRCNTADDMSRFYTDCMENRSVSSTKLNDQSSRSHAIFTITISRTMVEVLNELGTDMKAKVRTIEFTSKLHLVDLAGSERVKRSGVTGKELKEATHINSGLLALGNVIVALSTEAETKKKGHIPYRDSKLTRLLQDSLGGNSLTVLISCISPSEMDFEETNNTLKYANRACSIKNTPLPMRYTALEEDLLPSVPQAGGMGLVQLQALLEDHERMKEMREKKDRERKEKEAKRLADLASLREEQAKKPGYQRLRASAYDELRRQLASKGATNIPQGQVIADDALMSFGNRHRLTSSVEGLPHTPSGGQGARPASSRPRTGTKKGAHSVRASAGKAPAGTSFADWLASQAGADEDAGSQGGPGTGSQAGEYEEEGGDEPLDFIVEDDQAGAAGGLDAPGSSGGGGSFIVDDGPEAGASVAPTTGKSKFRRGPGARAAAGDVAGLSEAVSSVSLAQTSETGATSMDVQVGTPGPGGEDASRMGALEGEEAGALAAEDDDMPFDPIQDDAMPKLLARFKVNTTDVLSVFKAVSKEDFQDVVGLLPANTPLPASDKMTYLLARLEVHAPGSDLQGRLARVATGESTMNEAVGPAVGCLMATFGTNMISSCIFEFPDPEDIAHFDVEERIELWGLQIPHNSVRPQLQEGEQPEDNPQAGTTITWTSVDRLNMSIGLLYALCNHALDAGVRCGFCVPRPQLLKRWLQAGVLMRQITGSLQLIYPPSAHDYEYYKASTVAYFMIQEVQEALKKVLGILDVPA